MARTSKSRNFNFFDQRILPAAYRLDIRNIDPDIDRVWARWFDVGAVADFQTLATYYLPLTLRAAKGLKLRCGIFQREDLDALVSDSTLGLFAAIKGLPEYIPGFGRKNYLLRACLGTGARQCFKRWGMLSLRSVEKKIHRQSREKLVRELGRIPTPDELAAEIAKKIHNTNIDVGDLCGPALIGELWGRKSFRRRVGPDDPSPRTPGMIDTTFSIAGQIRSMSIRAFSSPTLYS